ncbi:MAG: STAS domain-containing protein [Gammaproteobacteria bacterium]|jgi:anti-sigma B factor antagonist|nr:STAS domain-containing protein [Gammaproteobacteria bacterium]MDH3751238.1 STAS domain-containing protein [Gammaproteobacteria bacterium]MDH3804479.1 STAS domain-containing protein [Gammaproteobacteria bacterium]
MFAIEFGENGDILCSGRLDAAECAKAQDFMDSVSGSSVLDFAQLEYISSAGLGILLKTQKRLVSAGEGLKIINVNNHIHDVFRYSGFHSIFEIETQ